MHYEPKACRACAKAKRKCDKELPACLRCRSRGVVCDYPPIRPGSFVAILDAVPPAVQQVSPPSSTPASLYDDAFLPLATSTITRAITSTITSTNTSTNTSPSSLDASGVRPCLAWFLESKSWEVGHPQIPPPTSLCNTFLKTHVLRMQGWLGVWAATGACPFIHGRLYAARFPDCLQVALLTLTTYNHRTPCNTDMVLKIVEDQASKLVEESDPGSDGDPAQSLSLLDQAARLHALIVYQVISLFDGDIRTRHLAEARLPLLGKWSSQLLDSARQKFSATSALLDMTVALHFGPMDSKEHPWYLWILAESIRRTWLIAVCLEAVYSMLQRGWHPCPGGVMFTTRQGVWDAPSALAWEESCFAGGKTPEVAGFMHRFETMRLFQTTTPGQVDEFTQLMLEVTYGVEQTMKWRQEKKRPRTEEDQTAAMSVARSVQAS
ncbi:MAG: hypothetical protein STHCBS139747_006137 [Sporothrix thermara]